MKRVLFSISTYFQLLVCLHLRKTYYSKDICSFIISDVSNGWEQIYEKLKEMIGEERVFYVRYYKMIKTRRRGILLRVLAGNDFLIRQCSNLNCFQFDEFLFCNYDYFNVTLAYRLLRENKELKVNRYEEGYRDYLIGQEIESIFLKLIHLKYGRRKRSIWGLVENMFYFTPEMVLYENPWEKKKIQPIQIEDKEFRSEMKYLFFQKTDISAFQYPVIFFEEAFYEDQNDVGDLKLVLRIAELVGKENLLVKLHPRTHHNRFSVYGIHTNQELGIPWEAIQLYGNFEKSILISISSGSVLSPGNIAADYLLTYLLYDCIDAERIRMIKGFDKYVEVYQKTHRNHKLIIPRSMDEFYNSLKRKVESRGENSSSCTN